MAKKKLPSKIEITELMLVKAGNDFKRTYMGEIYRETTIYGKPLIRGKVVVNDGCIYCATETQTTLSAYLDDICLMKLDMGLHSNIGLKTKIGGHDFFLN